MSNYLIYSGCQSEDSINECRYSLLKFLAVYNLIPPANISVIVYTSRPVLFEVFLAYFKNMEVVEAVKQTVVTANTAAFYEGSFLFCSPYCHIQKPIGDLYHQLEKGRLAAYRQRTSANNWDDCVSGIGPAQTDNPLQLRASLAAKLSAAEAPVVTAADSFIRFKNVPEIRKLLRLFFKRNEEESLPNLIKRIHHIDTIAIQKEAQHLRQAPLLKKLLNFITGRNDIVRRYQNKL